MYEYEIVKDELGYFLVKICYTDYGYEKQIVPLTNQMRQIIYDCVYSQDSFLQEYTIEWIKMSDKDLYIGFNLSHFVPFISFNQQLKDNILREILKVI